MSHGCIIVTGAAQGIGAAVAAAFLDLGRPVAMFDRSDSIADKAAALDNGRGLALAIGANVDDEEAFSVAYQRAADHFGHVSVMVNNAARTSMYSVWDIKPEDWDSVMRTNLRGTFFGCRIAGKAMRAAGQGGRIINMTSIAGQRGGTATGADYAASKAGILVLTKVFAQELAGDGITVNAVAPAAIAGPMVDALSPDVRARLESGIPVGRFGLDREVAAAAVYLASDHAAFVTGATLDVNGGLLMR